MHEVLPFVLHIAPDTRDFFETIKLEIYDLTGVVYSDDELLHFLCNTYCCFMGIERFEIINFSGMLSNKI